MIKEILKSVCCSDVLWCYGILWGFHDINSLLLTLKDAYYGEEMRAMVNNVLLQVHVLGEGTIGEVAFSNKSRWIFSDSSALGSSESLQVLQDNTEFCCQFDMGIKTIAIIPVEEFGVVQLGSTQKIPQNSELAEQVNGLFRRISESQNNEMLENGSFSSDHFLSSSSQFLPVLSSEIPSFVNQHFQQYPVVSSQPFPSTMDHENTALFTPSFIFNDHFQIGDYIDLPVSNHNNDSDSSILASSWPLLLRLNEENSCFDTKHDIANDYSQWFSPQPGISSNSISNLLTTDLPHAPENIPSNSLQSSVTYAFRSTREEKTNVRPYNSLFSQLGLDQIPNNSSCSKARFNDQFSSAAKRRKIENYSYDCIQEKNQGLAKKAEKLKPSNAVPDLDSDANLTQRKQVQHAKVKKGRAGAKKRPKDRQMIQDRLAELRELIPNGDKMSIDRLLERTIRNLNFMQGVNRHAESLKNVDNQKCEAKGKDLSSNGVTWAYEVDNKNIICPLIVQDLNTPGQMLIEIICEEHGFLLEIADIIRGFGLIILKGVMEVRDEKIWAHYIVDAEGNQHVTRHKVFSSLVQLLQITGQSLIDANESHGNMYSSLFDNHQPDAFFPVNSVDSLDCGNL